MTLKIVEFTDYFGGSTREEFHVSAAQLAAGVDIAAFLYEPHRCYFEPFTAQLDPSGSKVKIEGPSGTRFYPVNKPGEYRTGYITVGTSGATIEGERYEKDTDVRMVVYLEP